MNRHELKTAFLQMDWSNVKESKQIIVRMTKSKFWPGYGDVEILREGPDGYSSFKTHQENPLEYAENLKEYRSGEYKLIIK
tara:strand:+ start:275 stop:517 length:243 start_codon:yes stop_codon:yes gene_type:complete